MQEKEKKNRTCKTCLNTYELNIDNFHFITQRNLLNGKTYGYFNKNCRKCHHRAFSEYSKVYRQAKRKRFLDELHSESKPINSFVSRNYYENEDEILQGLNSNNLSKLKIEDIEPTELWLISMDYYNYKMKIKNEQRKG